MKTRMLALFALLGLVAIYATPAYATTVYAPSFQLTATSLGAPIFLTVSTTSSGGSAFEACTDTKEFYYSIHSITVTDPNGNGYASGSSATEGLYWPNVLGGPVPGPTTNPLSDGTGDLGDALNVTLGDSFVLPFGSGAGGFTFVTSLGSPPQTHAPEGPYYWWTLAGNVNGAGLRLDQHPSINPTNTPGTYVVEVEGIAVCGTGTFFDQGTAVPFDTSLTVTIGTAVPEFSGPVLALVAVSLVAVAMLRKDGRVLPSA
jgi:hypothetical protein